VPHGQQIGRRPVSFPDERFESLRVATLEGRRCRPCAGPVQKTFEFCRRGRSLESIKPRGPALPRISISSILIGQLVDKALLIPLIALLIYLVGTDGAAFSSSALAIGTTCTCIGSFVAATRAGDRFIAHGIAVAAITLILSFLRFLVVRAGGEPSIHSLSWEITSWIAAIAAGCVGGLIAQGRSLRKDR